MPIPRLARLLVTASVMTTFMAFAIPVNAADDRPGFVTGEAKRLDGGLRRDDPRN